MGREGKWDTALMLFRVQERITKAIYIRRRKGEKFQLGRLPTVCENVEKYTGYAGNRFPEELTACGHKIPRVVHAIHKFPQAIPEIARPRTTPPTASSTARAGDNLFQQQSNNRPVVWRKFANALRERCCLVYPACTPVYASNRQRYRPGSFAGE